MDTYPDFSNFIQISQPPSLSPEKVPIFPASVAEHILKKKAKVLVAQLCLTLCDPMDFSPPGSSFHEILQARILESIAISFSRGSSWPRDWTQISCIASRFFTVWATRAQTFLCTRHYSRDFIEINSLNPHVKVSLLFPFYRWTN